MATPVTVSNLAKTIFTAGPNDAIAVIDAYTDKPTSIINTLVGKLSAFDTGALDGILGKGNLTQSLTGLFTGGKNPFSVDTKGMEQRVAGILGGFRGITSTLTSSVLGSLTQGLGLNAQTANALTVTIGGIESRVISGDPMGVASFTGLLNTLVGDADLASVLDLGAYTSLVTGVISACIGYGISSALDSIINQAPAGTEKAVNAALKNNVLAAIQASDLTALTTMVDRPGGAGLILSQVPDATAKIMQYYRLPKGMGSFHYLGQVAAVTALLTAIDSQWNVYARRGGSVDRLGPFVGASAHALTIFAADPLYQVQATIAKDFTKAPLLVSAKRLYPYASLPAA